MTSTEIKNKSRILGSKINYTKKGYLRLLYAAILNNSAYVSVVILAGQV